MPRHHTLCAAPPSFAAFSRAAAARTAGGVNYFSSSLNVLARAGERDARDTHKEAERHQDAGGRGTPEQSFYKLYFTRYAKGEAR